MRTLGLAVALMLLTAVPAAAAPALQPLGSFATPVAVTAPPGDGSRVMVVEKGGTVRMLRNGVRVAQPFLDVSAITLSTDSERGLLSIAFPPDYQRTGLFYAFLTAKSPTGQIQIREFHRADADHAAPGTGRLVFAVDHSGASNHNGGQLQFDRLGRLWFTIGDAANSANAQNTATPLGKLNRIDPHASGGSAYTVPADNPFGNSVWAYGLRNPWRFSFDRTTGDLLIGDVGDGLYEEIDYAPASLSLRPGANYGWPCQEGLHDHSGACVPPSPLVAPVVEQPHSAGWQAIIGGYVVRDPGLPSLAGRYLYGDFNQPVIRVLNPATGADAATGLSVDGLTAFGEDACGRIYTAAFGGTVSRLVDGSPSPCNLTPTPGPNPTTPDTTPCKVKVGFLGTRQVTTRHWLRVRVRSKEGCRLTISGRVPGMTKFRTLRRSVRAGRTVPLKLRLTKRANRRLAHAVRGTHSRQARVRVRAVDAAGNERVLHRRVRIRG